MTEQAAAPAPAGSMLPAAPALNTPEGMAARKNTHPAMRGQVQPGTELPAAPAPAAPVAQPQQQVQAPAPVAPVAPIAPVVQPTPVAAPPTSLIQPVAPPPLQYAQPAPAAAPAVDPQIAEMRQQLDEQLALTRKAQADQARQALLNPQIDWSSIDVPEDQAQALNNGLVRPQLEAIYNHFEGQMATQNQRHEQALAEFKNVGSSVAEVAHQQTVNQNLSMSRLNGTILAEHPTFAADMADPTFIAQAGVYHDEITQAYASGNAAQVNQAMAYVKSLMAPPTIGVEGAYSGGPVATTSPAPDQDVDTYKQSDSRAAFEAYQRNEMSRADYLAFAATFKEALQQGRVTDG